MIPVRLASRSVLLGVFTFILATTSGCGSSFGTVTGKVTVDGKQANNGTIIFSNDAGKSAFGRIKPDGTYEAVEVPTGPVKVTVLQVLFGQPGKLAPGAAGKLKGIDDGPVAPGGFVTIPEKYKKVETSGLSYNITSGINSIDIELISR